MMGDDIYRAIIRNDIHEDGFSEKPVKEAFRRLLDLSEKYKTNNLTFYIPLKSEYEHTVVYSFLRENKNIEKHFKINIVSDKTVQNFIGRNEIVFAYLPTEKGVGFLSKIRNVKAVLIIPKKMSDFSVWCKIFPVVIISEKKQAVKIEENNDCYKYIAKLTKDIGSFPPNITEPFNKKLAIQYIKEIKSESVCSDGDEIKQSAMILGWSELEAEKLKKLFFDE